MRLLRWATERDWPTPHVKGMTACALCDWTAQAQASTGHALAAGLRAMLNAHIEAVEHHPDGSVTEKVAPEAAA
jgi:hypothetical protein